MKIGIIIETNDPEKVWNALRFAVTGLLKGHEASIFLLGVGVELEEIRSEKFDIKNLIDHLQFFRLKC